MAQGCWTLTSTPVATVNVDIAMGQVAGPNPGRAIAQAQIYCDRHVTPRYGFGRCGFVIPGGARALFSDDMATKGNSELVAICGFTRLAYRHHHPAPIGVIAGDGGF